MEWIILGVIVLLTLMNVPIGYALSIATILAILWTGAASLSVVPLNLFSGASSFPLLAIPLFILAGGLMETGGISQRLVNLANSLVGFIRGGLAMVTVVATMIQSEISGSSVADAAAIGKVVIPAMEKRGYPRALSAAIVSNAASAAILIPPSIPMIIYAWMAEVSIAKLFFAGFLPGVIACLGMMALCYYYARKYNLPREQKFSVREVGRSTRHAFWALFIPVVIWAGILGGVATATEVAALAVLAAFVIGLFIYRELNGGQTVHILKDSVAQTASVMLIVASSAVLGWFLTSEQVPQKFARMILETAGAPDRRRSDPFRHHRHHQPRRRPADAAGGDGSVHHRGHRAHIVLGSLQGGLALHARAGAGDAAGDLRAVDQPRANRLDQLVR
jgi:tripartite ATP-independent transporter DctM subunit